MSLSQIRIKIQLKNSLVILTITQLRNYSCAAWCMHNKYYADNNGCAILADNISNIYEY